MDTKKKKKKISPYMVFSTIVIILLAIAFAFPLYWILTGSFKTQISINSTTPEWWPSEWVATNYDKLFSRQKSPLWEFAVPFSSHFSADGKDIIWWAGPQVPAAVRWLINTVFMAVASMILTCITSAMAGYALAKKRFVGRSILFTLIVCAMALPKQVILIPLLREMSSLQLYNTIWAVIFPIVGWPFGVFLMKQFSEGIPGGEVGELPPLLVLLAEPGGLLFPLGNGETGESASVGAHGGGPPSWLGERMAPDPTRDRRPVYKGIVARPACPGQAKSW